MGAVVHWGVQLVADRRLQVSATAPAVDVDVLVDPVKIARVLGAAPTLKAGNVVAASRESMASRFVLRGVLAGDKRGWAALISVDGQPAQPFRVGAAVAEDVVLQSVAGNSAFLGSNRSSSVLVTLNLPEPIKNNNQRPTRRSIDPLDNPESPVTGAPDPEADQVKDDLDGSARMRLSSGRRAITTSDNTPESMPNIPEIPNLRN